MRKEVGNNVLNYSSIRPYEKHLRDVSPINDKKKGKAKSFIKTKRRPKSVIGQKDSHVQPELPLNKNGANKSKKSYVSRKSINKNKKSHLNESKVSGKSGKSGKSKKKKFVKKEEVLKALKKPNVHRGPLNLEALSKKNPKKFFLELID